MTQFYRNFWKKKLGKLESLRQAQVAMLRGELYEPPRVNGSKQFRETCRRSTGQPSYSVVTGGNICFVTNINLRWRQDRPALGGIRVSLDVGQGVT